MQLTNTQKVFLKMVKSNTATRKPSNRTAKLLKQEGYLNYSAIIGWWLTPKGLEAIQE